MSMKLFLFIATGPSVHFKVKICRLCFCLWVFVLWGTTALVYTKLITYSTITGTAYSVYTPITSLCPHCGYTFLLPSTKASLKHALESRFVASIPQQGFQQSPNLYHHETMPAQKSDIPLA